MGTARIKQRLSVGNRNKFGAGLNRTQCPLLMPLFPRAVVLVTTDKSLFATVPVYQRKPFYASVDTLQSGGEGLGVPRKVPNEAAYY